MGNRKNEISRFSKLIKKKSIKRNLQNKRCFIARSDYISDNISQFGNFCLALGKFKNSLPKNCLRRHRIEFLVLKKWKIEPMKTFHQFLFASLLILFSSSFATCCGDITSGSLESGAIAPSGGGGGSAEVRDARVSVSASLLKVSGVFELTNGSLGVGNSRGSFFRIGGDYDLEPNEAFALDYDFNVMLRGGGTVNFTTTATTMFNGVEEVLSNSQTISEDGTYHLTFGQLGVIAETAGSGSWTGQFSFDWLEIPPDATLTVEVPTNSIDFSIRSVPEPNTFAMAMVLAVGFVSRRRRTS